MAPFRILPPAPSQGAYHLLFAALVLTGLYVGRDILAPLALALLLTIAAIPVVGWLERYRVPRLVAVLFVLCLMIGVMVGVLHLVFTQTFVLLAEMPRYEAELRAKIQLVAAGSGPIDDVARLIDRLTEGLSQGLPGAGAPAPAMPAAATSPFSALLAVGHAVVAPMAMLAITFLLMAFLLMQREDVRDRALRLAGTDDMHRTTRAMQEATDRVGRFLLMQLVVNACFGTGMGLGLWALGVPQAPLWGALGFVLRFVPFLGAPLAALFPLVMAFATTPGWMTVILVLALFVVVDITVTYVLEPWLFGVSTGVTPLALVLSSVFWGALWGPVGLILTPALTACLAILGRNLPGLGFLDVMLSDRPALSAPERFYQRLLAGDPRGAVAQLAEAADQTDEVEAIRVLAEPALLRIAEERSASEFGPAMAVRAARTLMTTLEPRETPAASPGIVVTPLAGAVDRAAAAVVVAGLHGATPGGGPTGAAVGTPGPTAQFIVLVMTGGVSGHRAERMQALLRRLGIPCCVYAPTAAAQAWAASQELPVATDLAALLGRLEEVVTGA